MLSQNGAISILLVIRISTDPTLFHVGCRPTLHVGLQHLYLTLSQNGPPISYIWPHLVRKARPALTSDLILSERPSTHIWPHHVKKAHPTLTYDFIMSERPNTHIQPHYARKSIPRLTSDLIMSKRIKTHIWPHCVRKAHPVLISYHVRKDLHLHLTMGGPT